MSPMPMSEIVTEVGSKANSAYTTGKFIKKLRASTQIPIEHRLEDGVEELN